MIYRTLSVEVDEQTNIGVFGNTYLRFDGDNFVGTVEADEVLKTYVMSNCRIPESFTDVRQKLQALL